METETPPIIVAVSDADLSLRFVVVVWALIFFGVVGACTFMNGWKAWKDRRDAANESRRAVALEAERRARFAVPNDAPLGTKMPGDGLRETSAAGAAGSGGRDAPARGEPQTARAERFARLQAEMEETARKRKAEEAVAVAEKNKRQAEAAAVEARRREEQAARVASEAAATLNPVYIWRDQEPPPPPAPASDAARIRREQDEALAASLASDMARERMAREAEAARQQAQAAAPLRAAPAAAAVAAATVAAEDANLEKLRSIWLSAPEPPESAANVISLALRLPGNRGRISRRFPSAARASNLLAWTRVFAAIPAGHCFRLLTAFPRVMLATAIAGQEVSVPGTCLELGLKGGELLVVEVDAPILREADDKGGQLAL